MFLINNTSEYIKRNKNSHYTNDFNTFHAPKEELLDHMISKKINSMIMNLLGSNISNNRLYKYF